MPLDRTEQGLESRLSPQGFGRFGTAAFLFIWLLIWAAGEFAAASLLGWGGWLLATGRPPGPERAPLELAPSLCMGLFLLAWLLFWSLGGILAGREFLRMLFGWERLIAHEGGVFFQRSYGLFRRRRNWGRERLRRFFLTSDHRNLALELDDDLVELSDLGSVRDRLEVVNAFNVELSLDPQPAKRGWLPRGWEEMVSREEALVLVQSPVARQRFGIALWALFLLAATVTAVTIRAALQTNNLTGLAVVVGLATAGLAWAAFHVSATRLEWGLSEGCLLRQKRVLGRVGPPETLRALHLLSGKDSDGDLWHTLVAVEGTEPTSPKQIAETVAMRTLSGRAGDPTELRNFGLYLSTRCGIPYFDHTLEATASDPDSSSPQSGPLSRWFARLRANRSV